MRAIFSTAWSPRSTSICLSLARPRWYWESSGIYSPFFGPEKLRYFFEARKLLMSMTFARRNALFVLDNLRNWAAVSRQLVIRRELRRGSFAHDVRSG